MKFTTVLDQQTFEFDLSQGIDISTTFGEDDIQAWYLDPMQIEPVRTEHFTGSVAEGGSVNFRNIAFNPHGHGTHTECYGHISKEQDVYLKDCLKSFYFPAYLTTPLIITKMQEDGKEDHIVSQIEPLPFKGIKAIILRTQKDGFQMGDYSNTNPCYMDAEIIPQLLDQGIEHLMIDQPSVDREEDGGALLAHHAFFGYPNEIRKNNTITELCKIAPEIQDGLYMVHISIFNMANDAVPSKITLYPLK